MHLSPIKGAFPHKDQHDRTAPVAEGQSGIERGSVVCINDDNEFVLAGVSDAGVKPLFLALQPQTNLEAAMAGIFTPASGPADLEGKPFPYKAGKFPKAAGKYSNDVLQGGARPAISGIHMDDGDVWETDMFDADDSVNWEAAKPNAPLTVANGGLITLATGGAKVIGYLVKGPYKRYCNDAPAVKDMMTGAYRYVIQFQCGL